MAFWTANYTAAPASGWNGDISTCTPGTTSAAYQSAIAKRIKETSGDLAICAELLRSAPEGFRVLQGLDEYVLPTLAL